MILPALITIKNFTTGKRVHDIGARHLRATHQGLHAHEASYILLKCCVFLSC